MGRGGDAMFKELVPMHTRVYINAARNKEKRVKREVLKERIEKR